MMSLDVYLTGKSPVAKECYACGHRYSEFERVYEGNITHNLSKMAEAACIYKHLWRPEELGITEAKDLIGPLGLAVDIMEKDPDYYKKYDSPNRWGVYENFLPFVKDYLNACIDNPEATISVSR